MIQGFEKQTHELNEYELNIVVPAMVKSFQNHIGDKNSITSSKAIKAMKGKGYKIEGPRFRKCVNYIRVNGLVSLLLASSKGYYVATSRSSAERFIESLEQRINAITTVRDSLEYQLKQKLIQNK